MPGDLVFFGYNGKICHVTMYIGNGQIIHSSNKKYGVIISNLNYSMQYLGACRII